MRLTLTATLIALSGLICGLSHATPCWEEHDFEAAQSYPFPFVVSEPSTRISAGLGYSYPFELAEIAEFLSIWQVSDTLSPHFGGMREGECCGLETIIETDNTQESIWIWCRFGQVTGDTVRYRGNIDAA